MISSFRSRLIAVVLLGSTMLFTGFDVEAKPKKKVENKSTLATPPAIEADEKSFAEIFRNNIEISQTKIADARKPYDMEFSALTHVLSSSELINDYYIVDLAADPAPISMVRFGVSAEVFNRANFFIAPTGTLAYAFREGSVNALAKRGGYYRDVIRLQWAPLQAGTRIGYRFPQWSSSVQLKAGLSYEWISLSGNLDGINQSSWLSGYQFSLGGTFFESDRRDPNSWFGGLTLSAGTTNPFATGLTASFLEAGIRIFL